MSKDWLTKEERARLILEQAVVAAARARAEAIEECARIVEECHVPDYYRERMTAAIRALKDRIRQ